MRAVESVLASSLKPILFALPVFLLLPATLCHAESCEPGGSFPVETVTSITPSTMYAGQTYNVVIMGSFPYDIPAYPGCNLNEDYVDQDLSGDGYPDVSILKEPGSIFYSQGTFSATEITLTITIGPDAPPGTAYLVLTSDGGESTYVTFQIACPIPTITSISPNVWFAGQSYPITITGTGFITPAMSTATGCPVSKVQVSTSTSQSTLIVPVEGTNVVNSTEIAVKVMPKGAPGPHWTTAAVYGAQGVTVQVTNVSPGPTFAPNADVLGEPVITWTSDPDGTSPTISGTTQEAVVGQQIQLTTEPTAATLEALPIPLTFSSTNPTTWTVTGGTNIGGYTPTSASYSTASVAKMTLNTGALTFYSVDSPASPAATYTYCVTGQTTCPQATATFNVTGPTDVSVLTCGGVVPGTLCSAAGALGAVSIESVKGQSDLAFGPGDTIGIVFTASASATPPGAFSFVQLITFADAMYFQIDGTQCPNNLGPGYDGGTAKYPYGNAVTPPGDNNAPTSTDDSPSEPLFLDDKEVTANFSATMYVMWTPSGVPSPIPVPLGSVAWGYSGDAIQNTTTGVWSINPQTTSQGQTGSFEPSDTYPIWSTVDLGGPPPCK